jgi:hypothetical protein
MNSENKNKQLESDSAQAEADSAAEEAAQVELNKAIDEAAQLNLPIEEDIQRVAKTNWIDVEMTEEEIATCGKDAAALKVEIDDLEGQLDAFKKTMKGRIDDKTGALNKLLERITHNKQAKLVEYIEEKDYKKNVVRKIYLEKVIEERAMTAEEHQQEFPIEELPAHPEAGPAPENAEYYQEQQDKDIQEVMREESNIKTKKDHFVN